AGAMAQIAAFIFGAGVIGAFGGVDVIVSLVHLRIETNVVEDEEFSFRAEIGRVADARRIDIFLGRLGDRTRAAVIGLARGGLGHVAEDRKRRLREERVDD